MTVSPERGDLPLTAESLERAIVCPIQKVRMEEHIQHLGVFTENGDLVTSTIDDRHHGTHLYRSADLSIYPSIVDAPEPEAIYAGVFFHHYGHFLLESLSRLWYAKAHPELPIIWIGVDSWPSPPTLRSWQRDILDLLKIKNPVRVLTQPERFELLRVPDAGYKYADFCHPQQARFLAVYDEVQQINGRKIWFSRKNFGNGVGIINAGIIEKKLMDAGWTIVSPEKLPIKEQLRIFAEAEEVAGEEGSAFHSILLLRDISQKKLHIFLRHGREHISFRTIGNARSVNQEFHSTKDDALISTNGRAVQRLSPNASQVLNSLGVPVRKSSIKDASSNSSVRRVNAAIKAMQAKSYLEIGVRDGSVFNYINVEKKVALETNYKFDTRYFTQPGVEFYELTPMDYVDYFSGDQRFDVIFINNCHLFEDVIKTFTTLLPLTHKGSVFIIDNVFPCDEFSAMRDREEALRQRCMTGNLRKAWHGDVYKSIFLIRLLFPSWMVATISNNGNQQSVISRRINAQCYAEESSGKVDASVDINSLLNIDYKGMLNCLDAFNFSSEEEILSALCRLSKMGSVAQIR